MIMMKVMQRMMMFESGAGSPPREGVQSITEITSPENMTGSSEKDDGYDGGVNDDDDDIADAKDDDV